MLDVPPVRLYGKRGCPVAYSIRDFLQRSDVPFEWIELRDDEQARKELGVNNMDDVRLPICIFPDGTRMEHPTVRQITEKLGWFRGPSRSEYDIAIYGAGPAGLSAAVYGASEGLKTVVVERFAVGGQAGTSPKIENYLGFPGGISGAELAERAREQATKFGAEILLHRTGVRGEFCPGKGIGYLDDGTKIISRVSVCATGVEYRRLNLPTEDRLLGAGIYYGAGASEASLCGNEHVVIVGAGNSAAQASLHLAHYARMVTIVMRGERLNDSVSEYLVDRIKHAPNIEIVPQTRDQRSASAQRTYRWRQSPQRDFAETSSRVATAASKVAPYISRPSTGPPQSQASEARHGSGAPQSGFSLHIRRIRSRRPRSILGRPALLRDFQRQNILKPARCQRRMVSG